jgi:hypothetical protein
MHPSKSTSKLTGSIHFRGIFDRDIGLTAMCEDTGTSDMEMTKLTNGVFSKITLGRLASTYDSV